MIMMKRYLFSALKTRPLERKKKNQMIIVQ